SYSDEQELAKYVSQTAYFYRMLENVKLDKSRQFMEQALASIRRKRFPSFRHFYVNLLKICMLIVNESSITIESQGRQITLPSFVINMHDTFQRYLLNMLKSKMQHYKVLDGNNDDYNKSLFDDIDVPRARPDIIIRDRA